MISVIAKIEVVPGRRDDFLAAFREIVPLVLQEEGCLAYAPMIDVPTSIGKQEPAADDVVTVVEQWDSIEALEAHLVAPHMIAYRKKAKPLVANSSLQILKPA